MSPKFDIISLLKACNYCTFDILVSIDGDKYKEVSGEEFAMLNHLNTEGALHIEKKYKGVIWAFTDCIDEDDVFEVEYHVEEDEIHFNYGSLSFKTKYTLINILKSQREWKCLGYSFYDNETEEIVGDNWYEPEAVAHDAWLNQFEESSNMFVVDSRSASLYKVEEKGEDEVVQILSLVIGTNDLV